MNIRSLVETEVASILNPVEGGGFTIVIYIILAVLVFRIYAFGPLFYDGLSVDEARGLMHYGYSQGYEKFDGKTIVITGLVEGGDLVDEFGSLDLKAKTNFSDINKYTGRTVSLVGKLKDGKLIVSRAINRRGDGVELSSIPLPYDEVKGLEKGFKDGLTELSYLFRVSENAMEGISLLNNYDYQSKDLEMVSDESSYKVTYEKTGDYVKFEIVPGEGLNGRTIKVTEYNAGLNRAYIDYSSAKKFYDSVYDYDMGIPLEIYLEAITDASIDEVSLISLSNSFMNQYRDYLRVQRVEGSLDFIIIDYKNNQAKDFKFVGTYTGDIDIFSERVKIADGITLEVGVYYKDQLIETFVYHGKTAEDPFNYAGSWNKGIKHYYSLIKDADINAVARVSRYSKLGMSGYAKDKVVTYTIDEETNNFIIEGQGSDKFVGVYTGLTGTISETPDLDESVGLEISFYVFDNRLDAHVLVETLKYGAAK